MVQGRSHHVTDRPAAAPVREEDRVEERHVGDVGGEDDVQERVVGQLAVGAEPDLGVRLARCAEPAVRRLVDIAQVDRLAGLQKTLDDLGIEVGVAAQPFLGGRQGGRVRGGRHGGLVVEALLVPLEGGGQREDRLSVLDGDDAARGEGPAVVHPVDRVDDGRARVAHAQEVRVQGVGEPVLGDRPPGGDQCLRRHLPAEDARDDGGAGPAAEDVLLDLLDVEQIEQIL